MPLPYATKENYKVILYRLVDFNADKVGQVIHRSDVISSLMQFNFKIIDLVGLRNGTDKREQTRKIEKETQFVFCPFT